MRELKIVDFYPKDKDDILVEEIENFISDALFLISNTGLVYDRNDISKTDYGYRGAVIWFSQGYTWAYNIQSKIVEIKK